MPYGWPVLAGLGAIMALVLALPLSARWIEEELEVFLLAMGCLAVTLSGQWSRGLVIDASTAPVKITLAVLACGFAFRRARPALIDGVLGLSRKIGLPAFSFALVFGLGLAASVVTAIVAALVLSEIVSAIRLGREAERSLVVCACYSIGLGAVLTPIGEPLSTIAAARLAGAPGGSDFFFLAKLLWPYLLPAMLALGGIAARAARRNAGVPRDMSGSPNAENAISDLKRALKVYVFVFALEVLGKGLSPLAERCIVRMPFSLLYWANISSAAVDNATLAAAELSAAMGAHHTRAVLIALLVSGGMLVPGNIPNIISANKLGIGSREWAREAIPLGLAMMTLYYVLLTFTTGRGFAP